MSPVQTPGPNGVFSSSIQADESELALVSGVTPAIPVYHSELGSSALPPHPSSKDGQALPQVRTPSFPSRPLLGRGEYVVPLPAEGKIKDHYLDCIRSQPRLLAKFTRSTKSTGRADMPRVNVCFEGLVWLLKLLTLQIREAEQMRQLIHRLNDTTTHLDLGLGVPATQSSDNSVNEATWAYYASSKFAFLHHLITLLRYQDCYIAIIAKEGVTLNLLEAYMKGYKVNYRRPSGFGVASPCRSTRQVRIDLIATGSDLRGFRIGLEGVPVLVA
jgi:hypothetical protein